MGGSGGPNPKGKVIEAAKVVDITLNQEGLYRITFEMPAEDGRYFEDNESYKLIAIDK